jgi:hypothetical protein
MITVCPPARGPDAGLMEDTDGGPREPGSEGGRAGGSISINISIKRFKKVQIK